MTRFLVSSLLFVSLHAFAQDNPAKVVKDNIIDTLPPNTLARLQEKDSIVIKDHVLGCFVNMTEKIVIVKQGGKFIANCHTSPGKMRLKVEGEKLEKTTVLTKENIDDFIKFETELKYLQENDNCTTTESYDFSSKYWNIKKVDGSCHWNGFYNLKKKLFRGS